MNKGENNRILLQEKDDIEIQDATPSPSTLKSLSAFLPPVSSRAKNPITYCPQEDCTE